MSKADQQFVSMCRDILDHGTTTEGQKVRPVWEEGTPAYTIKNFGVTARYDLREEFPALTLRRTALKSAMDEILWIYQKKSNNVHDLNSHIWDEWADETGSIGKAYGYQIGQKSHYAEGDFDQMDRVLVMSKGNVVMEGTPKEVFSQTEKVRALRLDVPQAAELRDELVKAGIPMPEGIIDTGACAQALYELLK